MRERVASLARLRGVAIVGALAGVLALLYGPANIGYDPAYSVAWGHELFALQRPDFLAQLAPTPHPLANVLGGVASLFGSHGYTLLVALSFVSFAGVGYAAYLAGERSFGPIAGLLAAAVLLTRPLLIQETLQASLDLPCIALVTAALAVELGEQPRPRLVLALLALAGLLRPEVWLVSCGYLLWVARTHSLDQVLRLAPLAALAPLLWLATDFAVTGNPLFSLTRTQTLAIDLQRPTGLLSAASLLPGSFEVVLGAVVVWCGIAGCAVATWVHYERARLFTAVLVAGCAGFLVLGVAHLPILDRYVLIPSVMLTLLAGATLAGWRLLPRGSALRRVWTVGAAIAAIACAASIPSTLNGISSVSAYARGRNVEQIDLRSVLNRSQAEVWLRRCGVIQVPTHVVVPELSLWIGLRPSQIVVTLPHSARRGLLLTAPVTTLENDAGLFPGTVVGAGELTLPRGFHVLATNSSWTLAERC